MADAGLASALPGGVINRVMSRDPTKTRKVGTDDRRDEALLLPRVISLAAMMTSADATCVLHVHLHDELCLVTDDSTTITHGGRARLAPPGTLFLFRRGESHGYRNDLRQRCRLWVVHFHQDQASYTGLPWLDHHDPDLRTWQLDHEQQNAFRSLFLKLQDEHCHPSAGSATAESAWLRLLITFAGRLTGRQAGRPGGPTAGQGQPTLPTPHPPDAELAAMIARLTALLADPTPLEQAIPNYDSLRHRFRRLVGRSPREWLAELRLRTACNLLLETDRPIKAIATDVGYARQHEFTRAFTRAVGRPPTAWRREPGLVTGS